MDLRIEIRDDEDMLVADLCILQDGSDVEGAARIVDFIRDNFTVEADYPRVPVSDELPEGALGQYYT